MRSGPHQPHSSATLSLGYLAAQKQTELMLQGQTHGFIACRRVGSEASGPLLSAMSSSWNQHFLSGTAPGCVGSRALSHAAHDWLGPAYLPLHAILQAVSVMCYFIRPIAKFSPWHAYNPLERVLICVPIDVIVDGPPEGELASNILREFGFIDQ